MKVEINNKNQVLSIGLSDIGSYLKLHKPLAILWYDCNGSIGKFFSIISSSKNELLQLNEKLHSSLFLDLSTDYKKLQEVLQPFFDILENGEYGISFIRELKTDWAFQICNRTNVELENEVIEKFEANNSPSHFSLIEKSTCNTYPFNNTILFATIPAEEINHDKVKEYELLIKRGERPFAIGMSAFCQNDADGDWYSEIYILDGHHKIQAYANLKLKPAIALIYKDYKSILEPRFNYDLIEPHMYKWQSEHLFRNWEGKDKYKNGRRTEY